MTTEQHTLESPTVNLLKATAKGKLFQVIQAINNGAHLAVNKNGHNALHIASHKGFLDIVRILLSAGCEIDVQDDNGDTALHRACISGHDLIVKRLLIEGCSVDRQNQLGDTPLHEAASRGYSRCVEALIEGRANIGLSNKNLDTAIHLACANSHSGSLRLLLSSYPQSSPRNLQGDTPLHVAVRFGHVTCARVLISAQYNINIQNKKGNTALHIAVISRHHKLVRILLDAGASANTLHNNEGKSPLDIARENGDGETAILLLSGPRKKLCEVRGRKARRDGSWQRSRSETRKQNTNVNECNSKASSAACVSCGSEKAPLRILRPKSETLPRKRYIRAKAKWRRHERRKCERLEKTENALEVQQKGITVNPFVVPQLYSLYRDSNGNVRQTPVIDRLPNPTPEIVSSITNEVVHTRGELLQEMKKTNCLLEKRIDQLESNTCHKVAKLDQIMKERIHAERIRCLHRIDSRAMLERNVVTCRMEESASASTPETLHSPTTGDRVTDRWRQQHGSVGDLDGSPTLSSLMPSDSPRLEPYRTIKISTDHCTSTPYFGLSNSVGKSSRGVERYLDRSDSAYSSFSPRPTFNLFPGSPQAIPKSSTVWYGSQHRQYDDDSKVLGRNGRVTFKSFSEDESKVNKTSARPEFFENITHALENWYEKRLQEITDKQQKEMDGKVAELEKKIKILQLSAANADEFRRSPRTNSRDLV